ncbi:unnamed protein product [Moneuplotes crassus]|uniref:Uncharacterized protein n=1 Tax=Euplotes crassus TaxID=5936 RepID=A0AAD1XNK2_EUPCR|nr:unnamed protein product [Moneuplotes crassus]
MFKTAKSLCLLLLVSSLAITVYSEATQYPVYMWAQKEKGKKIEYKPEVGSDGQIVHVLSSQVSEEVKNILETTDVNSFIVYTRPGMTTQGLVDTLVNNKQIGTLLKESKNNAIERSFIDVVGESVSTELTKKFENIKTIVVDSEQSLKELKEEFASAPKPFIHQYYIINVAVAEDKDFNEIVFQLDKAFTERTLGNHISILSGSPIGSKLQEVTITKEPELRYTAEVGADEDVFQYTTSNILTKGLIGIPIVFLIIISVGLLMDIKTPTLFVSEGIDFGKIEK